MGTIAALVIAGVWVHDHWQIVLIALVVLILIIRSRRKARAARAAQAVQQAQRLPFQTPPAAPAPAAPKPDPAPAAPAAPSAKLKFIDPPKVQDRFCLTYFYPDVEYIVPSNYEANARKVPPLKTLTLTVDSDTDDVFLSYEGHSLGRMRNNRLRGMVRDFDRDDRAVLAASVEWIEKPLFSLAFYETLDSIHEKWSTFDGYKEYTLTGNANQEMQDNLFTISAGYAVEPEMDYEKDKYLAVADGLEIGYFPQAFEDYITEHDAVKARILSITEKDDGRYSVRVMVIPG